MARRCEEAEVLAITQALLSYPARTAFTVLSPSSRAVDAVARLATGHKIDLRLPSWLFQRARRARKCEFGRSDRESRASPGELPAQAMIRIRPTHRQSPGCGTRTDSAGVSCPTTRGSGAGVTRR